MINMSQVQYPSDFVGSDGKLYPTVGEAFRKGSIEGHLMSALKKQYNFVYIDIITITFAAGAGTTYTSKLGINYSVSSTFVHSKEYNIISVLPISSNIDKTVTTLFSIGYNTSVNKLYINIGGTGLTGTQKIMVVIAK